MINKELKHMLRELKDNCHNHKLCRGCYFYSDNGCILKDNPEDWKLFKLSDKWHTLYGWLVNIRAASVPDASLGLKEYTIQQARLKLIDNIIEYMNKLDEEEHDET